MVTPCTGLTLLYKPVENAKNQKFELFFYYGQNVRILTKLKLTIITFEQELVSI